jgi:hypothetical protein
MPMRWQRVVDVAGRAEDCPTPRGAHGAGYLDGKIVVFGGYGPGGEPEIIEGDEDFNIQVVERPLDDLFFLHLCRAGDDGKVVDSITDSPLPEPG